MSAKPSAEMRQAIELIRAGMRPLHAAKTVGLNPATVYRSALYKELKKETGK